MLITIIIIISLIGVWAFWDNIWYKYYYVKLLVGEISYNSKEFVSYDFSKYKEEGIVGVHIGIPQSKEDICFEALLKVSDRNNCSMEDLARSYVEEGKTVDDIVLDNFYIEGAIIPQNRITKKYGRYEGEIKAWIQQ